MQDSGLRAKDLAKATERGLRHSVVSPSRQSWFCHTGFYISHPPFQGEGRGGDGSGGGEGQCESRATQRFFGLMSCSRFRTRWLWQPIPIPAFPLKGKECFATGVLRYKQYAALIFPPGLYPSRVTASSVTPVLPVTRHELYPSRSLSVTTVTPSRHPLRKPLRRHLRNVQSQFRPPPQHVLCRPRPFLGHEIVDFRFV